jgi:trk system potassium uptake protein TrkA
MAALAARTAKPSSLVNKEEYLVLAATSGSDIALNKKVLAANEILKFIRRGELLSVAHLHGFDAEVVEIIAAPNSPITRIPLSKIDPDFTGKYSSAVFTGTTNGKLPWAIPASLPMNA